MKAISSTKLRENIDRILDQVLETGQPLEIERKGQVLVVTPQPEGGKLAKLKPRPTIKGDPEELVSIDWSSEWRP